MKTKQKTENSPDRRRDSCDGKYDVNPNECSQFGRQRGGLGKLAALMAVLLLGSWLAVPRASATTTATLGAIADQNIVENAPGIAPLAVNVDLTGIAVTEASPGTSTITATSSAQGFIPNASIKIGMTNATGRLTFTPVADKYTKDTVIDTPVTITVTITDDNTPVVVTFLVNINNYNRAPSCVFTTNSVVALENAAAVSISSFVKYMSAGVGESAQTFSFAATPADASLFSAGPSINPAGTLSFTLATDKYGTNVVTVVMTDTGSATAGVNKFTTNFTVVALNVNQRPTFAIKASTPERMVILNKNAGAQTVSGFATTMATGNNEAWQTYKFVLITSSNAFFKKLPAIDSASGDLSLTVADNAFGFASVKVYMQDNGGTKNGGTDCSLTNSFYVVVKDVVAAPTITGYKDVTMLEDKVFTFPITVNEQDHANLKVTASGGGGIVTPTVTGTGPTRTVVMTPVANKNGATTITLTATDSLGTPHAFTTPAINVTVTPVNDAPDFTLSVPKVTIAQSVVTLQTTANFLTGISKGGTEADETAQTFAFTLASGFPKDFFTVAPAIDTAGTLTYTKAAASYGTNVITVTMQDNGGTANGGKDSVTKKFTMEVSKIDQQPSLTVADIVLKENFGKTNLLVTVADPDTALSKVTVSVGTSSADSNKVAVAISGSGANRIVSLTSKKDQYAASGSEVIVILTANDGESADVTKNVKVEMTKINLAPVIAKVPNVTLLEDTASAAIVLDVTDDTAVDATHPTWSTKTSSKQALIKDSNIAVTYVGGKWQVVLTPEADANSVALGSAVITLVATDVGGLKTTNTFMATVTAVNDQPTFGVLGSLPAATKFGIEQKVPNYVKNVVVGPADELKQTWKANVSVDHPEYFSKAPAVDKDGTLTYTLATLPNSHGNAILSFTVTDSGGTANSGVDTSAAQTKTLTIGNVDFASVTGEFNGLFFDTVGIPLTPDPDTAGYVNVNLTASGAFTGYLLAVGTSNRFVGQFDLSSQAAVVFTNKVTSQVFTLALTLDTTAADPKITGTAQIDSATATTLRAVRSVVGTEIPVKAAGSYNMAILGDIGNTANTPGGDSITWITVDDTGIVSFTGWMGDGIYIKPQTTAISIKDEWPLYVPLYNAGKDGAAFGWIQYDTTTTPVTFKTTAKVTWGKKSSAGGSYYPGGFNISKVPMGSAFQWWDGWNSLPTHTVVLTESGLTGSPLSLAVTLQYDKITPTAPDNGLSLLIEPFTTYIAGTFTDNIDGVTPPVMTCYGLLLQNQQEVHGYFLNPTSHTSGRFELK